jgi:hypothetical protein
MNPYQYTQLVYESATDDTRMQKYLNTFGTYEEMEGLTKIERESTGKMKFLETLL